MVNTHSFLWDEGALAVKNYSALGKRLAAAGDLYRNSDYASGLLLASSVPNIAPRPITSGADLAPIILDRVRVKLAKDGKSKGSRIPATHLNTMLRSEAFLQAFDPVDQVVKQPWSLGSFEFTSPGYNDGGPGQRILHVGEKGKVSDSLDTMSRFLDVMAFASNADLTNAVALALTILLRGLWPGAKPVGVVTSTKSHGGKDTIIAFAAGSTPKVSVDYQSTDWAFRQGLIAALRASPEAGLVNVENARLGHGERFIASGTLERFLTDPEPTLHSTKARDALKLKNHLVITISTKALTQN